MKIKQCRKCQEVKPLDEFKTDRTCVDDKAGTCLVCCRLHSNKYYHATKNLPEFKAKKKEVVRRHDFKRNYGITPELYDSMMIAQCGVCFICGAKPKKRRLSVDHCHDTNQVRGLLCNGCNVGIGHLKHNKVLLLKAIEYLDEWYIETIRK